jgi:hypothetical protein
MYGKLEDGQHILLGCSETKNKRINMKYKEWLHMHVEIVHKKIIICNTRFLIKDTVNYLFQVKGKWGEMLKTVVIVVVVVVVVAVAVRAGVAVALVVAAVAIVIIVAAV